MNISVLICAVIGALVISALAGFLTFIIITNLISFIGRSLSFWWLVLKADKFHDGNVIKDSYKKRKLYKIRLLFRIMKREGPKIMLFKNDDSLYNEYIYWSPAEKYVKEK